MKKHLFILITFISFIGCMSDRQKFEKEFAKGCLTNYPLQYKEAQKACECLAKLMASKFTDKELAVATKKYKTGQERYIISQKMSRIEGQMRRNQKELEKYITKCMQER